MMLYTWMKRYLFMLEPECAHRITLQGLSLLTTLKRTTYAPVHSAHPQRVMGLTFPNRVGLAAGLDKNGDYIDALASLGFGFIEIGTVTPKAQIGNPKPRLFRLTAQASLINRMGFNNKGADYVAMRLQKIRYRGILGINIGKNKDTSAADTISDYQYCFRKLAPLASYITINISSPNTQGLRDLQQQAALRALLIAMKNEQALLKAQAGKYVPLVVKIAPDLDEENVVMIAQELLSQKIDGVIATNTTVSREHLSDSPYVNEAGGASGQCLNAKSTHIIKILSQTLAGRLPIIASGGVMDAQSANEKLLAGASLVQVYTGLIYQGAELIHAIA